MKNIKRIAFLMICFWLVCINIEAAEQVDKLINGSYKYTNTEVNYRSAPDDNANIIEVLSINTLVFSTNEINNEYVKCEIGKTEGYIHLDYLADEKIETPIYSYLGEYKITGYKMFDPSENGGRSDGLTASGVIGEPGHTVAMKNIPFGTRIYIKGLGEYVVEDRGVGSGVVDIACWSSDECYAITGYYDVYIIEE